MIVTEMLKGMSVVHPYLKFFCFFGSWFEEQQTQLEREKQALISQYPKASEEPDGAFGGTGVP